MQEMFSHRTHREAIGEKAMKYKQKAAGYVVKVYRGFGESFEKKFRTEASARRYARDAIKKELGYEVKLFARSIVTEYKYTEYYL